MKLPYNQQQNFGERPDYAVVARQSGQIRQTYARTTKKQHCVPVTGIKLWNCIENYIKIAKLNKLLGQTSNVF